MSSQPTPGKLSPDLLQALHGIKSVRLFPKGATLFQQGSAVTGVYLVESGEVRVMLSTGHSQKQLLEVVGPGIKSRTTCMQKSPCSRRNSRNSSRGMNAAVVSSPASAVIRYFSPLMLSPLDEQLN